MVAAGNIGCIHSLMAHSGAPHHSVYRLGQRRAATRSGLTAGRALQAGCCRSADIEEIIALVIGDDEGREIFNLDPPDRFHAKFGIFQNLDLA